MRKIRFKPFAPLIIGAVIVLIGAYFKIINLPSNHDLIMGIGLIIEFIGILYFLYRYKKMRRNEKKLFMMQDKNYKK